MMKVGQIQGLADVLPHYLLSPPWLDQDVIVQRFFTVFNTKWLVRVYHALLVIRATHRKHSPATCTYIRI